MKLNTILLFLTITIGAVSASSLYSQESLSIKRDDEKKPAKVVPAQTETNESVKNAIAKDLKKTLSKKAQREEMDAPTDADGNNIIIEMPVMKKRKTRESVMEMPGPPVGPPKFPTEFKCLVGWGTGNMINFGGHKNEEQVTVLSKVTSEGLLFKTKGLELKDIKGKAVPTKETSNVFMKSVSKDNLDDWVIPTRKIIGCDILPEGKPEPNSFSYEILSMRDDRKNGKFDQYSIQLRNDYVYLQNEQGDRMANPVNGKKFCADLKYEGIKARAAIAGFRQELYVNIATLTKHCNAASLNSGNTKANEERLKAYIPSTEAQIKNQKEKIKTFVDYKKTSLISIAAAEKEKEKQADIKLKAQEEIEKLKSELSVELIKVDTYQQNKKQMDGHIVIANGYRYAAREEIKKLEAEQKAGFKVNNDAAAISIKKAEDLVVKYEANAKAMAGSTRGITGYTNKSVDALKKIMKDTCGKSSDLLDRDVFKPVIQPLQQIYCTAEQKKVTQERKKRGIESEFEELR